MGIDLDGNVRHVIDGRKFNMRQPAGGCFDGAGNLIVSDSKAKKIMWFGPKGDFLGNLEIFRNDGGGYLESLPSRMTDISVNDDGYLIILTPLPLGGGRDRQDRGRSGCKKSILRCKINTPEENPSDPMSRTVNGVTTKMVGSIFEEVTDVEIKEPELPKQEEKRRRVRKVRVRKEEKKDETKPSNDSGWGDKTNESPAKPAGGGGWGAGTSGSPAKEVTPPKPCLVNKPPVEAAVETKNDPRMKPKRRISMADYKKRKEEETVSMSPEKESTKEVPQDDKVDGSNVNEPTAKDDNEGTKELEAELLGEG